MVLGKEISVRFSLAEPELCPKNNMPKSVICFIKLPAVIIHFFGCFFFYQFITHLPAPFHPSQTRANNWRSSSSATPYIILHPAATLLYFSVQELKKEAIFFKLYSHWIHLPAQSFINCVSDYNVIEFHIVTGIVQCGGLVNKGVTFRAATDGELPGFIHTVQTIIHQLANNSSI